MTVFACTSDPASAANSHDVVVSHFDLDLEVNFDKRELTGNAVIHLVRKKHATEVILDVHHLNVNRITLVSINVPREQADLPFELKEFSPFGSALHIQLPPVAKRPEFYTTNACDEDKLVIQIDYSAGSGDGFCWLKPEQTAGKQHPYLFTQGQACLNRTVFPCQDSPAVKSTFGARIRVPAGLTCVMSATMLSPQGGRPIPNSELVEFTFEMHQSIPSYLLAMVVGHLDCARIGHRSLVFTEPCMMEKAVAEFSGETEQFLQAGESLFGPYVWERYDLVVMPPCFPYGGMENPRLTFVTPCLMAGDKSLTDVIAHEIAHSWFGNLVTNAQWGEFWLNEGFTMYAQRRITTLVQGEAWTALESLTGQTLLQQCVDDLGHDSPLTRLRVPIKPGVDPDDTYNECAYEKGYNFVCYLRDACGGTEPFDRFLRSYCDRYSFRSVTSRDMFDHYFSFFPHLNQAELANKAGYEFEKVWLDQPGMPPFVPDLSASKELTEPVDALFDQWQAVYGNGNGADVQAEKRREIEAGGGGEDVWRAADMATWPTYQVLYFMDKFMGGEAVSDGGALVSGLAGRYGFEKSGNCEVRMRWCQLVLRYGVEAQFPVVEAFLTYQGKQKYTLPLYRAMCKGSSASQALATKIFAATRNELHEVVAGYVSKIMAGGAEE